MNVNNFYKTLLVVVIMVLADLGVAQENNYVFDEDIRLPTTSVKDQGRTGTCWSHATLSFLESELIRKGKGEYDLSEMYVVRHSYKLRAIEYVRYHGHLNFGPGAEAWDVLNVIKIFGIEPENVYNGIRTEEAFHNHAEMDAALKGFMNGILENKRGTLSDVWPDAFDGIMDAYLGEIPENFAYAGSRYTPEKFRNMLDINTDNYQAVTSFTHKPFYKEYVFESPDNWSNGLIYNVPLKDFIAAIDRSLEQGYTVAWASDVSDPGFKHDKGLAIAPQQGWEEMTDEQKRAAFYAPVKQAQISPDRRQKEYDNYATTDDHLMHIIGRAYDQEGTKYYIVKNSWGTNNPYKGYLYVSEAYVRLKTMSVLVHKNALNR